MGNLLANENTGIWIDNKFYPCDQNKQVLIPYSKETIQKNIIV